MNKYDFGYILHPGSSNEWAYQQIMQESTVLEIGPSNGNLVYHLTKDKNCIADIVEIDADAGMEAARFARTACIGPVNGNLERTEWIEMLQGNTYDYIIILDVLEHIRNPKEVLTYLKGLLKDEGKLLLSIPNIAHNSIILNLLLNKFEYTPVGLLDNTHIHFYTYASVQKLLSETGFYTAKEETKQIPVGVNEIPAQYGVLPASVEAFLKVRPLGTAYQFWFTLQKETPKEPVRLLYAEDQNYSLALFDQENLIYQSSLNPAKPVERDIVLPSASDHLRIDPLNTNCIIKAFCVQGFDENGQLIEHLALAHTGITSEGLFVFYDDDPQIYVQWPTTVTRLRLNWEFCIFDNETLSFLEKQKQQIHDLETEGDRLIQERKALERECEELRREREALNYELEQMLESKIKQKLKSICSKIKDKR